MDHGKRTVRDLLTASEHQLIGKIMCRIQHAHSKEEIRLWEHYAKKIVENALLRTELTKLQ